MEKVNNKIENQLVALAQSQTNPNWFLIYAACIVTFFMVQFFYFDVEMASNNMGQFIAFSLMIVAHAYSTGVKTNKRIKELMQTIK